MKRMNNKVKVILDLEEGLAGSLMGYCQQKDLTPSQFITNLLNRYMQEPVDILHDIMVNGEEKEFEEFQKSLREYLNEAIYDIEALSKSEEAYDTDKRMANVFKVLARDHLANAYLLTNLYKAYKEGDQAL